MRISDWSSDVCSSDLLHHRNTTQHEQQQPPSSYRRERHATGVDGKLPRELLGRSLPSVEGVTAVDCTGLIVREPPRNAAKKYTKIGRASCRERVGQYE